jgi:mannose/cellobiose epimerase-like protein (N-acyl-D-glucosamine 2-epimerase family)
MSALRTAPARWLAAAAVLIGSTAHAAEPPDPVLRGATWRDLVLADLMPAWRAHVVDGRHGGFHTSLGRDWRPRAPYEKLPAMVGRQVFSFTAAYLLSGDERHIEVARSGVDYLLARAWDERYGGWYDRLSVDGAVLDDTKTAANELYANVGLALYAFATGDARSRERVEASLRIRRTRAVDPDEDGYVSQLTRTLEPAADRRKLKHAHFGYVGSLVHLYQVGRDPEVLAFWRELMDLTRTRMSDPALGWVYGFQVPLDRSFRLADPEARGHVSIGGQLTAALAYVRLYEQSGDAVYLDAARALARVIDRGWDDAHGCWLDQVQRLPPHAPHPGARVQWWIHIYGALLDLRLHAIDGDPARLRRFARAARFYRSHFLDREFGGGFATLNRDGSLADDGSKAAPWHTSYHDVEHGLVSFLLLSLYVNREPATLHFRFEPGPASRRYVSLLDDPRVRVGAVAVDGEPWADFHAEERSVWLPASSRGRRVAVTLVPPPPGPAASEARPAASEARKE